MSDCLDFSEWFIKESKVKLNEIKLKLEEDFIQDTNLIEIVDQMLYLLDEMDKNTCSQQNEYTYLYQATLNGELKNPEESGDYIEDKWLARDKQIREYRTIKRREFLGLLDKHWDSLWSA